MADAANRTIRKVTPAGGVTTLAGSPGVAGSADGTGSAATFRNPHGITVDATGNVFIAESSDHTIRKITPAGVVTTIAGSPGSSGSADGTGSAARFKFPEDIAVDSSGNLYVADTGNSAIRLVTPAGVVTTFAGSVGQCGTVDGTGAAAQFPFPRGVAVDGSGTVYVSDNTLRKITPAGVVTTVPIGNSFMTAVAVDAWGTVYVVDSDNSIILKVTPAGVVSTLAGSSGVRARRWHRFGRPLLLSVRGHRGRVWQRLRRRH